MSGEPLQPRPVRMPMRRRLATLAAFLLASASGAAVAQMAAPADVPLQPPPVPAYANLPDMGSSANALISRNEEYQVGRMIVHDLRKEGGVLEDPELTEYIQNLGQRLGVEAQEGAQ